MDRIVLAADLATPSSFALEFAAALSRRVGAEVVTVHALPLASAVGTYERAEATGHRWIAEGTAAGGRFSQTLVLRFEAVGRLIAVSARELDARWIVAGAGARLGEAGRAILRSVDDCPLLLARGLATFEGGVWDEGSPALEAVHPLLAGLPRATAAGDGVLTVEVAPATSALARLVNVERALAARPGPLLVVPAAAKGPPAVLTGNADG